MYQNTLNNPPESCGCGTPAEIAYMGHNTGCIEFLHIHEREPYEVLLAVLKKRKKVTFLDDVLIETKKPRLASTMITEDREDVKHEILEVQKVPKAKEIQPNLSQTSTDALLVLDDTALSTSHITQPYNPPKSLPDLVTEPVDEADCPGAEDIEEMPPLEDIDR